MLRIFQKCVYGHAIFVNDFRNPTNKRRTLHVLALLAPMVSSSCGNNREHRSFVGGSILCYEQNSQSF